MATLSKNRLLSLGKWWLLAAIIIPAHAAPPFALNWDTPATGLNNQAGFRCNMGVADAGNGCNTVPAGSFGNISDPDKTPFLQQFLTGADGRTYYHMIIGSVDSNGNPIVPTAANESTIPWAQEVFIQRGTSNCVAEGCSYSGGDENGFGTDGGNGFDPLLNNMTSGSTGNRSGFPTRVIMKEVMNDGQMSQTFLKSDLNVKPKITQNITTPDMTAEYVLDMSNSNYSTNTTPGVMTNKVNLTGANAGIMGNFDANGPSGDFMTANKQNSNITGGRYTFVEGTGGSSQTFGQGTYSYIGGGDDSVSNLDWNAFRDAAENPLKYGTNPAVTRKRSGNICKGSTSGSIPPGC
ncbi:MAG: hypothetical protein IDH49_07270 [Gammaproteobacteria bacterium]|nr:hypothetical protein [Gammaproteobacteria bacterium]